ncbi:MAG: hypothetical protein CVV05_00350 [Gammaproteobacteria bacterium HGW-Gammaproteobacteria-1]|jgi:ankyrin repeat protein|nr:MAG: hypothetical protein CVV05_00350 [Gammaproteobacteria bacterium HGW-Gammaproteobacteria-1]
MSQSKPLFLIHIAVSQSSSIGDLFCALVEHDNPALLEGFVRSGIDLDLTELCYGIDLMSPLYLAASGNACKSVQLLLEHGANPFGAGINGQSALHVAAWGGHVDVIRLLLRYGANPDTKDGDGKTPLDYASERGHSACIAAMWSVDASADHQNAVPEAILPSGRCLL